ncbi:MAG: D-glycero-beta-D-manno-heptose-7-phosphate kinase, partial [Negativicoccus succinicivorans]|uniref:D-glycero-beta-D-manno-heptose-7-phosphate kinase n=1 Tax=Negativicoccus succinicivorans TaxID=620903 RepID=UPI0029137D55
MRTNGERFFRSLDTLRIIVVGDVMLDRYLFGQVARISPEAPVPVHRIEKTERRLGGAANVAANLRGLGCLVRLISVVGDDGAAAEFREVLRANDIDDSGILTDAALQTTTKTRVIGVQQQMLRIDQERIQDISERTVSRICEQIAREIAKGCAALVISDYGKGICTESLCQKVIQISRDAKVPVLVDPKQADWSRYRNATLVTPNLKELSEAYGTTIANHEREVKTAAIALMQKSGVQQVAVTRSAKGILWVDNESHSFQHPALAREVYDVSGAGDTVVAVLAAAIGAQLPRRFALHLANCAAGVVVGKVGTYAISQSELAVSLSDNIHQDAAVLKLSELTQVVKAWREAGDTIVFTNGCFD